MNHEEILRGVKLSIERIYTLQKSFDTTQFNEKDKIDQAITLGMMQQLLDSFGVPPSDEEPSRYGLIDTIRARLK